MLSKCILGKEWFEAVSEKLSVKDIATKMKFVMEGGNENLRGRISWNGLFNATSSWNDMNSVIQVAAEMIYVMEVGTEVKSTVEEIHLWWKLKQKHRSGNFNEICDVSTKWNEICEQSHNQNEMHIATWSSQIEWSLWEE